MTVIVNHPYDGCKCYYCEFGRALVKNMKTIRYVPTPRNYVKVDSK